DRDAQAAQGRDDGGGVDLGQDRRGQAGGLAGGEDGRVVRGAPRLDPRGILDQGPGEEDEAVVVLADGDVGLDGEPRRLEPEAVPLESEVLLDLPALDPLAGGGTDPLDGEIPLEPADLVAGLGDERGPDDVVGDVVVEVDVAGVADVAPARAVHDDAV